MFVRPEKKYGHTSLFEWSLEGRYLKQVDNMAQTAIKNKSDDFACAATDKRTTPAVRQNILIEVNNL